MAIGLIKITELISNYFPITIYNVIIRRHTLVNKLATPESLVGFVFRNWITFTA